jgi:hypothetical protein
MHDTRNDQYHYRRTADHLSKTTANMLGQSSIDINMTRLTTEIRGHGHISESTTNVCARTVSPASKVNTKPLQHMNDFNTKHASPIYKHASHLNRPKVHADHPRRRRKVPKQPSLTRTTSFAAFRGRLSAQGFWKRRPNWRSPTGICMGRNGVGRWRNLYQTDRLQVRRNRYRMDKSSPKPSRERNGTQSLDPILLPTLLGDLAIALFGPPSRAGSFALWADMLCCAVAVFHASTGADCMNIDFAR